MICPLEAVAVSTMQLWIAPWPHPSSLDLAATVPHYQMPCGSRQAKIVHYALWSYTSLMAWRHRWCLASQPPSCVPLLTPLMPPFACISPITRHVRHATDLARVLYHRRAGDELHLLGALCTCQPRHLCEGAALSWMFRHSKIPLGTPPGGQCAGHSAASWHHLGQPHCRRHGQPAFQRPRRSHPINSAIKLVAATSWGQSLVFLVLVTQKSPFRWVLSSISPLLSSVHGIKRPRPSKSGGGPPNSATAQTRT